jgi:hypothetical protein
VIQPSNLSLHDRAVLNMTPLYDVTCKCGYHRVIDTAPASCIRCGSVELTVIPAQGDYQ